MQPEKIRKNAVAVDLTRCHAAADRAIGLSRRGQALLAAAGMDVPARRWFVATVAAGMDKEVAQSLAFAGVECWLPHVAYKLPRRRGRDSSRPVVERLALPGYVFVRVAAAVEAWAGVASIKGVAGLLGSAGGRPIAVADEAVALFRAYLADDPEAIATVTNALQAGDAVSVRRGPFRSITGRVDEVDDERGRAIVEILLFGRVTPVDLDLVHLAKL